MPAAFDRCVKKGGRVITKLIGTDRYIHICYLDGKAFPGEVKTKKSEGVKK